MERIINFLNQKMGFNVLHIDEDNMNDPSKPFHVRAK